MASLKDIKVNINVDTTDFIKSLRQLQESIKMDDVRILKGYSKAEQRELEEAKNNNYSSAMILIHGIGEEYSDCQALSEKYYHEDANEDNQMARDIADYYAGVAKFPDKKYYVHFIKDNRYSYLTITPDGVLGLGSCLEIGSWKTKFTREEIIAMNPQLLPFMEEVEE